MLTVPSFSAAVQIVRQTDLITTVPDAVASALGEGLHLARPPFPLPTPVSLLVWHPRHTTDARHRFVRGLLQAVASARPPALAGGTRRGNAPVASNSPGRPPRTRGP